VNLGFFQGVPQLPSASATNFPPRPTPTSLSLVRLIHGPQRIDWPRSGTTINDGRDLLHGPLARRPHGVRVSSRSRPGSRAALLNREPAAGLTNQLFINSSIGAGRARRFVNGNPRPRPGEPARSVRLPAEHRARRSSTPPTGRNSAALLLAPEAGAPRANVIQVEDFGDQVVPQPGERGAGAGGEPPALRSLRPEPPPESSQPPPSSGGRRRTVHANAAVASRPPAHSCRTEPANAPRASITEVPGTVTFVPEFGPRPTTFPLDRQRPSRPSSAASTCRTPAILDEVLAWFDDIVTNGPPGDVTFHVLRRPELQPDREPRRPRRRLEPRPSSRAPVDAGRVRSPSLGSRRPDVAVRVPPPNTGRDPASTGRTPSILGTTTFALPTRDGSHPGSFQARSGTPGILPFFRHPCSGRSPGPSPGRTWSIAFNRKPSSRSAPASPAGVPAGPEGRGWALRDVHPAGGPAPWAPAPCAENGDCGRRKSDRASGRRTRSGRPASTRPNARRDPRPPPACRASRPSPSLHPTRG